MSSSRKSRSLSYQESRSSKNKLIIFYALSLFFLFLSSILVYIFCAKNKIFYYSFIGIAGSVLGTIYSFFGAYKANRADRTSNQLMSAMLETQALVEESPELYKDVFRAHISEPLDLALDHTSEDANLDSIDLLISTPAYGFHVLGQKAFSTFHESLINIPKTEKNIILFSPDVHYYHIANTLIWESVYISSEHTKGNDQKTSAINTKNLASNIRSFLEYIKGGIERFDNINASSKNDSPFVGVWITKDSAIRIVAYHFKDYAKVYLLLTDYVTLASNLFQFQGRLLSIPRSHHAKISGSANSFFEHMKRCPYTRKVGNDSRLTSEEILFLMWDYLFLRTEQALFDLRCFDSQIRQAFLAAAISSTEESNVEYCKKIFISYLKYIYTIYTDEVACKYFPKTSKQYYRFQKIISLPIYQEIDKSSETIQIDVDEILSSIQDTNGLPPDIIADEKTDFVDQIPIYFTYISNNYRDEGENFSKWISILFYLFSSGFRESQLAKQRLNIKI